MKTFYSLLLGGVFSLLSMADAGPYEISPAYEGVYTVKIECRSLDADSNCKKVEGEFPMIVMNASPMGGLHISIVDEANAIPRYSFTKTFVESDGQKAMGRGMGVMAGARPVEIEMEWSPRSGENRVAEIFGWIRDPLFYYDLRISGKLRTSTQKIYNHVSGTSVTPGQVEGIYTGTIGGGTAFLSLRPSSTGSGTVFYATLTRPGIFTTSFELGELREGLSVVNLWQQRTFGTALKWSLRFNESASGERSLDGLGFSSYTGGSYPVHFKRLDHKWLIYSRSSERGR